MNHTILVVDDSAIIRQVLSRALRLSGLPIGEIREAENGTRALAMLRERRPDAVITDINMPEMDGLELITAIRSDPALSSLPVLVVTAHGNDRVERQLSDHKVDGFVRKPFMPESIRDELGKLLAGRDA